MDKRVSRPHTKFGYETLRAPQYIGTREWDHKVFRQDSQWAHGTFGQDSGPHSTFGRDSGPHILWTRKSVGPTVSLDKSVGGPHSKFGQDSGPHRKFEQKIQWSS